jgi:hypothetical protein
VDRLAIGLARRTPVPGRLQVAESLVIAQSHMSWSRVRQRQSATGSRRRRERLRGTVPAATVGSAVGTRRSLGTIAQRGQEQRRRAHQPQKVHPGDHQHKLSVA